MLLHVTGNLSKALSSFSRNIKTIVLFICPLGVYQRSPKYSHLFVLFVFKALLKGCLQDKYKVVPPRDYYFHYFVFLLICLGDLCKHPKLVIVKLRIFLKNSVFQNTVIGKEL